MKWTSITLDGAISSDSIRWEEVPEGLLCVIIFKGNGIHRLIGADYYWVKDSSYGMVYDGSCCQEGQVWWQGNQRMDTAPPKDAVLKTGLMLPDPDWEKFMEGIDAYT